MRPIKENGNFSSSCSVMAGPEISEASRLTYLCRVISTVVEIRITSTSFASRIQFSRMNLTFVSDEEDDILNTVIQNSETGSVVYTIETPKYTEGTFTTTVKRQNQVYRSSKFLFRILWKGARGSLDNVMVLLDCRTLEEVPVREVLKNAPGSST